MDPLDERVDGEQERPLPRSHRSSVIPRPNKNARVRAAQPPHDPPEPRVLPEIAQRDAASGPGQEWLPALGAAGARRRRPPQLLARARSFGGTPRFSKRA